MHLPIGKQKHYFMTGHGMQDQINYYLDQGRGLFGFLLLDEAGGKPVLAQKQLGNG